MAASPATTWHEWWQALVERVRTWTGAAPPSSPALWWPWPSGDAGATYAHLYATQPHVRTVVDFLASQIAQLGIHVFRRISDTDRVRVHAHPLALLLRSPNEGSTRFTWMSEMVQDWAVFGNAYSVKLREPNRLQLARVPASRMRPVGDLIPRAYVWTTLDGRTVTLPPSEVFHLRQYNPDDPVCGLSPLETLRKLLAEEEAATDYRKWFWNNGARLGGWIARPEKAPRWTPEQRETFRQQWREFAGPQNAGKSPVLEDGMTFNPVTATARDSELIEARKLTREEVAAAYHVPPAMLGILEAQGYGSVREQHKALYQDTLGPTVSMLEGEIERQLLSEFSDDADVYVQFNISEKLQGSFIEEQAALAASVGSPFMTRNEARARMNLPRINDPSFDVPVTRLDIAEGQMAKTRGTAPAPTAEAAPVVALPPASWLAELAPPREPAELDALVARVERALYALPADFAAHLPGPPAAPLTRPVRDASGRIVAFEDLEPDGRVRARRDVVRDSEGRVLEIAPQAVAP